MKSQKYHDVLTSLTKSVKTTRRRGYAISDGELTPSIVDAGQRPEKCLRCRRRWYRRGSAKKPDQRQVPGFGRTCPRISGGPFWELGWRPRPRLKLWPQRAVLAPLLGLVIAWALFMVGAWTNLFAQPEYDAQGQWVSDGPVVRASTYLYLAGIAVFSVASLRGLRISRRP